MKRIATKNNQDIYEIFDTFSDFLETCDSRKYKGGRFSESARTRYSEDDDWAGTTYDKARDMLLHGYDKSVNTVVSKVNQLQKRTFIDKPQRVRDYVGFSPIVPNVILGYPKTMWNNHIETKPNRVITLLYDVGVSCGVSKKELEEHGARVVSYVMNLERLGYRIRIDAMDGFTGDHTYCVRIAVKHENQPINLKRVAFPMTHVGFTRTLGFDWYERCPDAEYMGGYGAPMYNLDDELRKKKLAPILGENEFYINYRLDPEEVFAEFADELRRAQA